MVERILSISRFSFIMVFIIMAVMVMLLLLVVVGHFSGTVITEKDIEEKTYWFYISALILAPIIETYIFQKLPIDFFRNNFKKDWPLILISAIPFGVTHYLAFNMYRDILYASGTGAVYAYAYIVAQKREDINAYYAVVLIHAGYNLFSVILKVLFG